MKRNSRVERKTNETSISLMLGIDGNGVYSVDTGVGFLNHMLELFAVHSRFNLNIVCKGDTDVDDHHSVEDIGIALGEAFSKCIGDKSGITRYGSAIIPMDEALVLAAVDISGRGLLGYGLRIPTEKIGTFDSELIEEFLTAFTRTSGVTLHIKQLSGQNSHHIAEAAFKAFAKALRQASSIDESLDGAVPSSKGIL